LCGTVSLCSVASVDGYQEGRLEDRCETLYIPRHCCHNTNFNDEIVMMFPMTVSKITVFHSHSSGKAPMPTNGQICCPGVLLFKPIYGHSFNLLFLKIFLSLLAQFILCIEVKLNSNFYQALLNHSTLGFRTIPNYPHLR
jgi:hypothetical protein